MKPTQAEIEAALKEMPANNAGYDKWGIWAWYHKDVLRSILSQPEQQEAVGDAEKIVDKILYDLCDRRGFKNTYWSCDEAVRNEIRQSWIDIVKAPTIAKPAGCQVPDPLAGTPDSLVS